MGRTATVVLVTAESEVLGALPPVELELPWWQESADLVATVRREHGVDVVVLRILGAQNRQPPGGEVVYLAQTDQRPQNLKPASIDETPQPHRMSYAEVNGPHRTLAWAREHLGPLRSADQRRTWNLSTIWRLQTASETVWLKQVPPFFGHEAAVIRWAAGHGARVPEVIAADGGRMLLRDIPGDDLYGAPLAVREAIARDHHDIQLHSLPALGDLAALGVPDRRGARLVDWLQAVLDHPVVRRVPELLDQAHECGLPDALVHGDLHPGNARGDAEHRTLLDWGDSTLGHPVFDVVRLTEGLDDADARSVLDGWAARWRAAYPGSDPLRAVELLRPVAALRNAAAYADFVAKIEPAEHPYHADDVPFWLERADQGLRELDGMR
jgi:phosphotransferase family enzyme